MMGIKEMHGGEKISPQEFVVTAHYVDEDGYYEEMDFIVTPGTSQAAIREAAMKYAADNLNPDRWSTLRFGPSSVPIVRF